MVAYSRRCRNLECAHFGQHYHAAGHLDQLALHHLRAVYRVVAVPGAQVWHWGSTASGGSHAPLRIYYSVRNHLLMVNVRAPARHRLH